MAPDVAEIIQAEFVTDGKTFVIRLAGTPFSGLGDSPGAAFDNLMQTKASAGALPQRVSALAREQEGAKVRTTLIRVAAVGIIIFGLFGGLLLGAAAMLPRVAADVTHTTAQRLSHWLENMPPASEDKLRRLIQQTGNLMRSPDEGCKTQGAPDGSGRE